MHKRIEASDLYPGSALEPLNEMIDMLNAMAELFSYPLWAGNDIHDWATKFKEKYDGE